MRTFTIGEILKATGGTLCCGSEQSHVLEIATDSRKAKAGDIFFALKGEVTDGHLYLDGALRGGCRSLVVSEPEKIPQEAFLQSSEEPDVIVVKDTTRALQDLAAYYLAMLPLRHKIAVTGSVGKTSTRDMLYYALRTKYKTARSMKNFNNGFGLPLSILEFPPDTEVAVLEMGMDDFGEIERLADLVRRPQLSYDDLAPFDPERPDLPPVIREAVEIRMKYAGYIARQQKQVEEFAREEGRLLPDSIDYLSIQGLRVEARQKLSEIRPLSVGQASRISGVSPADIAVLLIWLEQNKE